MNPFQGLIAVMPPIGKKNAGIWVKTAFQEAQAPVTFPRETKESEEIRYEENAQIFAGRLKERPIN